MAGMNIYYDSLTEASWFASLNPAFSFDKNNYHMIEGRGNNPKIIEQVTAYDKPDIIVEKDGKLLLVIEMTQEVPTGHNVGQRFARLVRAIEMHVPAIYYFPFDAKKHGQYSNLCNLNIRLLDAAAKMYSIHKTPLICVNWPTDRDGEIITDGSENDRMRELLKSFVESDFDKECVEFKKELGRMHDEYRKRLQIRPSYADLPNSVIKYRTADFIRIYGLSNIPPAITSKPYTYVYKIDMTPEKCKRQDPYTGMQFLYDYIVCRKGEDVAEKNNNLVLYFPNLTKDIWFKKNPNDTTTKSCNWYLTANMFLLSDGHYIIRG